MLDLTGWAENELLSGCVAQPKCCFWFAPGCKPNGLKSKILRTKDVLRRIFYKKCLALPVVRNAHTVCTYVSILRSLTQESRHTEHQGKRIVHLLHTYTYLLYIRIYVVNSILRDSRGKYVIPKCEVYVARPSPVIARRNRITFQ